MSWRCLVVWCVSAFSLQAGIVDEVPLFRLKNGESLPFKLNHETTHVAYYFSASWCPPCRKSTPPLVEEYQRMWDAEEMPVEIVLVGADRTESEMLAYMENYGMKWPAVKFGNQSMLEGYASEGIPHLVLVERETGKAVVYGTGSSEIEQVVDKMRELTGVSTGQPFEVNDFLDRFGLLIAVAISCGVIFLFQKWREHREVKGL